MATYDDEAGDFESPVELFAQEVEVQDTDTPQVFRIGVHRIRFAVEIMMRTTFGAPPALVPFHVKSREGDLVGGSDLMSTDVGVLAFHATPGTYTLYMEPADDSPFVEAKINVKVGADGSFSPMSFKVETKSAEVKVFLVTPDGQPAPDCTFHIAPQFSAVPSTTNSRVASPTGYAHAAAPTISSGAIRAFTTDAAGVATCPLGLLEPYFFSVQSSGKVMEYMPQQFAFQTDRRSFTAVVARSLLGHIPEERVALVVDASGSMQVYMEDIKVALQTALVQQFHKSSKLFTVLSVTENQVAFRPDLVDCSARNVEEAMRFCDSIAAGGGSNAAGALGRIFALHGIDAAYFITDGKCEVGEELLGRLRTLFYSHPRRPKLHTVGINCVPRQYTWRGLAALASLTQGRFRPVCLQQDDGDLLAARAALCGLSLDEADGAGGEAMLARSGDEANFTGGESVTDDADYG